MRRLGTWLSGTLGLVLTAAVLSGWWWLGVEMRRHAVPVSYAQATVVRADALPAVIGTEALGQRSGPRSASRRHLTVERVEGDWRIANTARDRRVFARTESGKGFYLHRWPLETGDRIVLPGAALEVVDASDRLELRDVDSGRSAVFDDGVLDPGGETVHLVCHAPTTRLVSGLRWRLRELAARAGGELRLFSVGGGVNCTSRWSIPALEPESIHIAWQDGRFQVAPGTSADVLLSRGGAPGRPFSERSVEVDGEDPIARLILGQTVYGVTTSDDALTLEPLANRDLWRADPPDLPMTEVAWAGAGLGLEEWLLTQGVWLAPGFALALLVAVGARVLLRRSRAARDLVSAGAVAALGVSAIGAWISVLTLRGEAADALLRYQLVIVSYGYASSVLVLRGRMVGLGGLVWATAAALALFGTVALLMLGVGAENSIWIRYFDKHALMLSLFGWTVAAVAAFPASLLSRVWIWLFNAEWIVATAGVFLLFGMAAQLTLGSETGIGGLQPVELTKSVYVVLLAFAGMHLMEVRRRDTREYRRSPLTVLLPFLRTIGGFALVVLSVVVGVRDFSPGIILGLVTLFWLFQLGRSVRVNRRGLTLWSALRPVVVAAMAVVVGAAAWAKANPEKLPDGMPQRDRILVWSQPQLHPHSGTQVLAAMDRVAEAGWLGAREWFGENEEVMKVPAVQDDFITAFVLNRFGGAAGLTLVTVQLLYLVLLFSLGRRIEQTADRGDFFEQHAGRVLGFTLFGLAWMHAVHWGIAWCNTLGLLPVMGQPMTWLSAGNSHLLGFALVSLLIALVTSWVLRELAAQER